MRKCDSCGKPYQETKDVFCPHCGAVAFKQCVHTSSFDSKRYDRGELYNYGKTKQGKGTYMQGAEPHAQRTTTAYTQPQKTYNGEGTTSIPKVNVPTIKTYTQGKNKKDLSKFAGIIVFCVIIAINMITGFVSEGDFDYYSDDEYVTDYYDMGDVYPRVQNASIALVEDDGLFKSFELSVENMYFSMDETDYIDYVEEQLAMEGVFVETSLCSFTKERVTEKDFDKALDNSYYVGADDESEVGHYQFTAVFDYGEIIFFSEDVKFYLENGSCVNADLPFDAFSIAEDGTVTYYSSYSSDETNWDTIFTECSNKLEDNSFTRGFEFSDMEG